MREFDILNFLAYYHRYPCLWDKSNPEFKIREKREAAEEVLLMAFGISTKKELRNKIRSIRCTYNQEVHKIRKMHEQGREDYTPKLFWFEYADSFLVKNREITKINWNQATWQDSSTLDHDYAGDDSQTVKDSDIKVEIEVTESDEPNNQDSDEDEIVNLNKRKAEHQISRKNVKIQRPSTKNVGVQCANDDFSVFGEHVGLQLNRLPLVNALRLQGQIHELLTQARIEAIQSQTSE